MPLSGLEIYKHLPRTNCKECGVATCLAFAMKVAAKQAGLDQCPHVSEAGKSALGEASAPPQRLVTIGTGPAALPMGQETVLFRHEEKFHHPAVLSVTVSDELPPEGLAARCEAIKALTFQRVGTTLGIRSVAVENVSGDAARFKAAAEEVSRRLPYPAVLVSSSPDALRAAAGPSGPYAGKRPLLCGANAQNLAAVAAVAKEAACPLCICEPHLEILADLTAQARTAGVENLVLSPGPLDFVRTLRFLTATRRAALKKNFRPLGYPVLVKVRHDDPRQAAIDAAAYVEKYAGAVVIDTADPAHVVALLATRQDLYTDPQKPVQVEARLYEINAPGPDAPLLITTNFSLSYYSVEGEVESSRVPARILAVDTEGTSVLTAWAADKLNPQAIASAIKKSGVEDKGRRRTCVLPGYVAVLSAGVREESGWDVIVGPKEASGIGPFLKKLAPQLQGS